MRSLLRCMRRIAAAAVVLAMVVFLAAPAYAAPSSDEITLGLAVNDRLDSAVDTDRYSFTLTERGYVNIDLRSASSVKAVLLKDNKTVFTQQGNTAPVSVGLDSGVYTLRVSSSAACEYSLTVDFTASGSWESEFNDGTALADPLPADGRIHGSIMQTDDRDFYSFSLSGNSYVSLAFSADKSQIYGWRVSLYDRSLNEIISETNDGSSVNKVNLNAGSYFVEIAPAKFSSASYTLELSEPDEAEVIRLGGSTRIQTAIEISRAGWKDNGSQAVVIANAFNFPDALAGETLASALNAPILLTAGKYGIEQEIIDEIKRLGASSAYILGGESVVCANIADELRGITGSVERLYGSDRYETAIAIARKVISIRNGVSSIYFASAKDFPDALSISPVAALSDGIILYMPATGAIPSAVADLALVSGCRQAIIVGGTSAISSAGESSIRGLGFSTERIGGADRYSTSTLICSRFSTYFSGTGIAAASGTSFPDALAGGVFAAERKMPVVLVGKTLPASVKNYAASVNPDVIYVFGGTSAVSYSVAEQLARA